MINAANVKFFNQYQMHVGNTPLKCAAGVCIPSWLGDTFAHVMNDHSKMVWFPNYYAAQAKLDANPARSSFLLQATGDAVPFYGSRAANSASLNPAARRAAKLNGPRMSGAAYCRASLA